jgi:Nuclease-related domain
MNIIIEMVTKLWYLWILVIVAGILEIFIPKIKGYLGEKSAAFFLSKLDKTKYKVINNIMLQVRNKMTQIDHVVVSNYGIFVIETKNYKGWIIGNEFDDNWKQVIY